MDDQTRAARVAALRAGLMERFFPLVVSVGFAAQFARIAFDAMTANGTFDPRAFLAEAHTIVLFVLSLVAIVGSWEGYFLSIERNPLRDLSRFCLDIAIVFSYLLLLIVAPDSASWFWVLAIIFALYVLWDGLSARALWKLDPADAQRRYAGRLHENRAFMTVQWCAFLTLLAVFNRVDRPVGFACAALAALCALVAYRTDKWKAFALRTKALLLVPPSLLLVLGLMA